MEEITCETGLQSGAISNEVFEREISLCEKLGKEKGGCCWGECDKCGVLPLLYKLNKGILLENKEEIDKLKISLKI